MVHILILLIGSMSIWKSLLQTINHEILFLNENKLKRVTNGMGYRCTLDASQIIWVTEGWLFKNTESSFKYRSPSFYFGFNDTRVRCSERQRYSLYHQNLNFMSLIQFTRFEIFIRSIGEVVQLELNECTIIRFNSLNSFFWEIYFLSKIVFAVNWSWYGKCSMYSNKQVFPPTVPTQKLEGRYWIRNYTYCINKGFDSEKKSFWMIFKAKFTWLKFPEFNPPFNLYQYLWY